MIGWGRFGVAVNMRAMAGALVGVAGVAVMVAHKLVWAEPLANGAARASDASSASAAVAAATAATVCYGYAVHVGG